METQNFFAQYKKEIIYGVIILIVLYIVKKNWYKIQGIFKPAAETNSGQPLTDQRKVALQLIATNLHKDIYETPWTGHDYTPYAAALKLYDDELKYLADYYKIHLAQGVSLHTDISSQWYPFGDEPAALLSKLSGLGKI